MMAERGSSSTSDELRYVRRRYLSAVAARAPSPSRSRTPPSPRAVPGCGARARPVASDSTCVCAYDQNLFTEWHSRYGGRGVLIYCMWRGSPEGPWLAQAHGRSLVAIVKVVRFRSTPCTCGALPASTRTRASCSPSSRPRPGRCVVGLLGRTVGRSPGGRGGVFWRSLRVSSVPPYTPHTTQEDQLATDNAGGISRRRLFALGGGALGAATTASLLPPSLQTAMAAGPRPAASARSSTS